MEPVRIGRYAIAEPLGRGAVGEVRAALDVDAAEPVAVKLLTAESARRPDAAELFAREVRAVARVNHPNVVRIFDQGVLDAASASALRLPAGSPWLAMEAADGSGKRPFRSWFELRGFIVDLLHALAHCHARELVHRDLKPGNVLRMGSAWKLADFGLAVPIGEVGTRVSGTPLYMAPEQFDRPDAVGPWTDLYALGCVVWEGVTGSPPFFGDARGLQRAHRDAPLPDYQPAFAAPAGLRGWLSRALAKDPTDRWELAADALRDLPDGGPLEPRSPAPGRAGSGLVGLRELPLVGRGRERLALEEPLERAWLTGGREVLVVEGPPGAGKTYLTRHVARDAAARGRARVLEVRHGSGGEGGLVDLAERLLGLPGVALDPSDREVLAAWVDFHSPTPAEIDRRAALVSALRTLSRSRPVLLVVDDLQWGPEAVRFVRELLAVGPPSAVVFATERREPGASSALPAHWPRLRVGGLGPDAAERLAAEVLGQDGVRAVQLAEISRGNPLLAVQIALHFTQTGRLALPADPVRGWRARLDAVLARSPHLEGALQVAAVLGGEVPTDAWGRLAEGDPLPELLRVGLIDELPGGWRLAHPLLLDAVLARLPADAHASLAGRVARLAPDLDPLHRASLLLASGDRGGAHGLALAVWREANARVDRERASRAVELARACAVEDPSARAREDAAFAFERIAAGDLDTARGIAAELPELDADAAHLRGALALLDRDRSAARGHLQRAVELAPDDEGALHSAAYVAIRDGRYADAEAFLDHLERRAGTEWSRARVARRRAHLSVARGEVEAAVDHCERAERLALASGAPGLADVAREILAEVRLLLGQPREAERILRGILGAPGRVGQPSVRLFLAIALLESGNPTQAEAMLLPYAEARDAGLRQEATALARIAVARIRAEACDPDGAAGWLDRAAPPGERAPDWPPEIGRQLRALRELVVAEPALVHRVDVLLGT